MAALFWISCFAFFANFVVLSSFDLEYEVIFGAVTFHCLLIIVNSYLFFSYVQHAAQHFYGFPTRKAFQIVSLIHSTLTTFLVIRYLNQNTVFWKDMCVSFPQINHHLCVSLGYFFFDLHKTVTEKPGMDFIVHASICVIQICIAIYSGLMHNVAIYALLFEISTIFLHAYTLLFYIHWDYAASILRYCFGVAFLIVRVIFGSYFVFRIMLEVLCLLISERRQCIYKISSLVMLINTIIFYVLNLYWFSLIFSSFQFRRSKLSNIEQKHFSLQNHGHGKQS